MTQLRINELEKEIEEKVQINTQPSKARKDYRIDLQKIQKLAQKIREFESQSNATAIR